MYQTFFAYKRKNFVFIVPPIIQCIIKVMASNYGKQIVKVIYSYLLIQRKPTDSQL